MEPTDFIFDWCNNSKGTREFPFNKPPGPYRYTDPSGRFAQAVMDNPGLVASIVIQAIPIGDA